MILSFGMEDQLNNSGNKLNKPWFPKTEFRLKEEEKKVGVKEEVEKEVAKDAAKLIDFLEDQIGYLASTKKRIDGKKVDAMKGYDLEGDEIYKNLEIAKQQHTLNIIEHFEQLKNCSSHSAKILLQKYPFLLSFLIESLTAPKTDLGKIEDDYSSTLEIENLRKPVIAHLTEDFPINFTDLLMETDAESGTFCIYRGSDRLRVAWGKMSHQYLFHSEEFLKYVGRNLEIEKVSKPSHSVTAFSIETDHKSNTFCMYRGSIQVAWGYMPYPDLFNSKDFLKYVGHYLEPKVTSLKNIVIYFFIYVFILLPIFSKFVKL
jgi:hypothetical protein